MLHGKSLKLVIPPQIPAKLLSLKKAPLTVNIILKNSIKNKYEYYYSGVTPLSFEENSILKLFFIFEKLNFIRSQSQWSSNQIYGTR